MTAALRFVFRPLSETDLPLLRDWLARPHLQRWWREADISLASVRDKYLPRILGDDDARPFLALLDGTPAGYIQWYDANAGDPGWWPDTPPEGTLGIDQFLADGERLGQGLGTAMVGAFAAGLFDGTLLDRTPCAGRRVVQLRVDPRPDNPRAIACYRKCGFRETARIETPDGPALMMVLDRPRG